MEKDVKWCDYFKDNRRYADIINGVACKGQQVVSQEELTELDTRSKKKFRDLICKVAMGVNFAIVGIENQDEIDYELPVRIMEYDIACYRQQIAAISKKVRENPKNLNLGEYMYGFKKESRLYPVTTIVLYAGIEPWDGSESLYEMIDFTDVRKVFDFIRYAETWDKLYELVSSDSYYQSMEEDAYEVIAKYANIKEGIVKMYKYKGKDGRINMCKGIHDLMENSKSEGKSLGIAQGKAEAIIELLEEYGTVPNDLSQKILNETELEKLRKWNKLAARVESIEEFKVQADIA